MFTIVKRLFATAKSATGFVHPWHVSHTVSWDSLLRQEVTWRTELHNENLCKYVALCFLAYVIVSVRMAWISFGALPCRKKLDDSSRLHVVEIARVAWHASFQSLEQENTCNSAHEQTPLSNDTIDSVLLHRQVGLAKDLSASPRTVVA